MISASTALSSTKILMPRAPIALCLQHVCSNQCSAMHDGKCFSSCAIVLARVEVARAVITCCADTEALRESSVSKAPGIGMGVEHSFEQKYSAKIREISAEEHPNASFHDPPLWRNTRGSK